LSEKYNSLSGIQGKIGFRIVHRRRDELFDRRKDPYALENLADNPEYKQQLENMKQLVAEEMKRSNDPLFQCLENGGSYPAEWDTNNGSRLTLQEITR